jgi:hypothetical protein
MHASTCGESPLERTIATTSASRSSSTPPAEPYGSGTPLVFDTSAWNRQRNPRVLARWLATSEAERLIVCPVVALELLASAPIGAAGWELAPRARHSAALFGDQRGQDK